MWRTATAHGYLATEKVSVIYGHIHRREYAARTREDRDGPKEIMAATPGCLARIDGVVPSTKGGTITGNQCFEGAAADLEGLVGYLDNPFEFPDDSTIFVAIR